MIKSILVFLVVFVNGITIAVAQNKVAIIPMEGDTPNDEFFVPIVIPGEEEPVIVENPVYLDQAIDKPIVWSKGWDTSIGHRTKIDTTVTISLRTLEPVFGYPGITFTPNEIRQWGEQNVFSTNQDIYAKGVLLVDKGTYVDGGPFEWSLNNQGFMSFHNIVRTDSSAGWILAWRDPLPGQKVWFFIMSNDEKFSSNPISFNWP